MKRTITIATAGFVLGCLLAHLAFGADPVFVQCEESPSAIGGYEFQAHVQPASVPPTPPIVFRTKRPAIPVEECDAKLSVGKSYLIFARALGGSESVTNAAHGVIKRHVADTPLGKPVERYLLPAVNAYAVKVQFGTNLTSARIGTNWFDALSGAAVIGTNTQGYFRFELGK